MSMTEEQRQAVAERNRERNKRKWQDPEYRAMMAEAVKRGNLKRRGRKLPEETKQKIAESVSKSWENPGDPRRTDEDVRARMRAGASKAGKSQLGRKASEEAKHNMSEAQKRFFQTEKGIERRAEIAVTTGDRLRGVPKSKEWCDKMSAIMSTKIINDEFHPEYWTKRGHHESPKAGRVYYRSSYELKAYLILDADPNVALYITEPCAIPYTYCGEAHRYIPDLYVEFSDGSWALIEIKPGFQLEDEETQTKHLAASVKYDEHFMIWSEQELVQ